MPSSPESPKVAAALENIRRVIREGRLPHALLVVGHPRGAGLQFTEGLLQTLFGLPDAARTHQNVDIHWLEPEGKGRQFKTGNDADDVIRPEIAFLSQTSYAGGWKAGVFLFADRLNETGQNRILKTLEEPAPNSLWVLVTDSPLVLLPTIRSRLQRIDVSDETAAPAGKPPAWLAAILPLLREPPPPRITEIVAWGDALAVPLRDLKEVAETEEAEADPDAKKEVLEGRVATRVRELREEWFRAILGWQRDVMLLAATPGAAPVFFPGEAAAIAEQARQLTVGQAVARVEAVEKAHALLNHNLREAVVFPRLARALALPPPPAR